jgi:hypothetical protein
MSDPAARRPSPDEHAPYYERYIRQVPDGDLIATLEAQFSDTTALLRGVPEEQGDHAYAPGKWSIKEVVGHVSDTERIFSYRLLRAARGDATPLPGYDENTYVPAGVFAARTLASLVDEWTAVRGATLALLRGLPGEAWNRRGTANATPFSVRAVAWILAGHERHHAELLRTRYLSPDGAEASAAS